LQKSQVAGAILPFARRQDIFKLVKFYNWLKTHKALSLLIIIFIYFGWRFIQSFFGVRLTNYKTPVAPQVGYGVGGTYGELVAPGGVAMAPESINTSSEMEQTTSSVTSDRMVIQNSNLSLLVGDVKETGDKILKWTQDSGGYMVSTSYNRPNESPFATISVRVPAEKFDEALNDFRSLAIKVINENLVGRDITENYEDIQARLDTLEQTKAKFLVILNQAEKVSDILQVQREIINLQSQIDALKGRQKAIEEDVKMPKITVYLSTDELSLPYTPDTKLRPQVVFKLAVRSLLNTLRVVAEALIWVGVYSAIWLPVVIIYLIVKRIRRARGTKV
jgi:hypothetical protein